MERGGDLDVNQDRIDRDLDEQYGNDVALLEADDPEVMSIEELTAKDTWALLEATLGSGSAVAFPWITSLRSRQSLFATMDRSPTLQHPSIAAR